MVAPAVGRISVETFNGAGTLDTSKPGEYTYTVYTVETAGTWVSSSASINYFVVGPPTVTISAPPAGQSYPLDASVATSFACGEATGGPGIASCRDSNDDGAPGGHLDTSSYGKHTYTVTAVSLDGQTTAQSISYAVVPPGRVGFVIDNGDYATNDPQVTIEPVWPVTTTSILISNDGGFGATGNATAFGLSGQIPWTLEQTGNDRLPKTVYLRFLGAGIDYQNFTDDIILDETAPTIQSATLTTSGQAIDAASVSRSTSLRSYRLRIQAIDKIVGVCAVAVASARAASRQTVEPVASCSKRGISQFTGTPRFELAAAPRYARVRNSAGGWSRWLAIKP